MFACGFHMVLTTKNGFSFQDVLMWRSDCCSRTFPANQWGAHVMYIPVDYNRYSTLGQMWFWYDVLDKSMVDWFSVFFRAVKYLCSIGQFPPHLLKDELARAHIREECIIVFRFENMCVFLLLNNYVCWFCSLVYIIIFDAVFSSPVWDKHWFWMTSWIDEQKSNSRQTNVYVGRRTTFEQLFG